MAGICSIHGEEGSLKGKIHIEDHSVFVMIILKWSLKK
jgi:hypothetical protein